MFTMDTKNIYEKIQVARAQKFLTNCYSMDVVEKSNKVWSMENEFMFSYIDHGIKRLAFFADGWNSLNRLIDMVDHGCYYLEFMTKTPKEYVPAGTNLTAAMMRLANTDARSVFEVDSSVFQYKDSARVEEAKASDTEEINNILWSTFYTEVSHLLSNDELRKKIYEGQISIHRNSYNQIDALLQAEVMPKKFYINQVVNKADRHIIHAILLKRLEKYVEVGGKYLYAWVEDKNTASLKFHEKYGMKHDGMWSMIYCLEK